MGYISFVVSSALLLVSSLAAANPVLWQPMDDIKAKQSTHSSTLESDLLLKLDHDGMKELLGQIASTHEYGAKATHDTSSLLLPFPDGSYKRMAVTVTHVLPASLQQKYPSIQTYKITGLNDATVGRIDISDSGFHAMLTTDEGKMLYIDPAEENGSDVYRSYWQSAGAMDETPHQCDLEISDLGESKSKAVDTIFASRVVDTAIHKYRIAVSATGEYTENHGGSKASAMAAIASTINRINQIYERDAAIHLELVDNNDELIFTSSANDPFSGNLQEQLRQNQQTVSEKIGDANYDVGHLFTTRGGGLAFVGSACRSAYKAMGISGYRSGDRFELAFVAHEIGHQFGATHTFGGNQGYCSDNNRSRRTAYEPGSGSTIMSYVGICGSDNLQQEVDSLFHIGNIQQMQEHKQSHINNGCGTVYRESFVDTEISAGEDYIIPANTPFTLTGEVSDAGQNSTLYNWEQIDSGTVSEVGQDTGNNALFRTFMSTSSVQRTFPKLSTLLGENNDIGETLPTTSRVMHFKFIAQQSQGGTAQDSSQITVVSNDQKFGLLSPAPAYQKETEVDVYWNVADTNLSPVLCGDVDISLSVDNGQNFDIALANAVANNGSAKIVIPASVGNTNTARFKLACSDNIFFSISHRPFAISSDSVAAFSRDDAQRGLTNMQSQASQSQQGKGGAGGSVNIVFVLFGLLLVMVKQKKLFKVGFVPHRQPYSALSFSSKTSCLGESAGLLPEISASNSGSS